MGGSDHQSLERLWTETAIVKTPHGTTHYSNGTVPAGVTPTITRLTPQQVWDNVSASEGYESGHSYSGNFAVKPGFILFGTAAVDKDVLSMAGEIVAQVAYIEDMGDSEWNPLLPRTDARCDWREGWGRYCHEGKTKAKVNATLPDGSVVEVETTVDCPQCKGTGRRPFTEDEQTKETERQRLVRAAVSAFGMDALRRAGRQYGEKWDEAAALAGKDHVWFGGVCSS